MNFLNIAKPSAGGVRSLLYVAVEVEYLGKQEFDDLCERSKYLSGSITNYMKSLRKLDT